jgi:TalC/MipB family fructose-6-phosphate aldolase
MELYLESHDLKEIEEAFKSGIPSGLTTSPAFIQRSPLTDETALIKKISSLANVIHIDALGEKSETIVHEAHRLMSLGISSDSIVLRIPVSMEGIKACRILSREGIKVNIQSVFTLQQAYVAMQAGAAYLSIPSGKLQDHGYDSSALLEQSISCAKKYNYQTKIMITEVRSAEHVRNAINLGVHAIALPWNIIKGLTENDYSSQSNQQFFESNRFLTTLVKDVLRAINPQVKLSDTILDAVVQMSQGGLGAVAVLDEQAEVIGVFTDGDLRRLLQGDGKDILTMKLSDLKFKQPISIGANAYLKDAAQILKDKRIDNLLVMDNGKLIGMLDIQDLN